MREKYWDKREVEGRDREIDREREVERERREREERGERREERGKS